MATTQAPFTYKRFTIDGGTREILYLDEMGHIIKEIGNRYYIDEEFFSIGISYREDDKYQSDCKIDGVKSDTAFCYVLSALLRYYRVSEEQTRGFVTSVLVRRSATGDVTFTCQLGCVSDLDRVVSSDRSSVRASPDRVSLYTRFGRREYLVTFSGLGFITEIHDEEKQFATLRDLTVAVMQAEHMSNEVYLFDDEIFEDYIHKNGSFYADNHMKNPEGDYTVNVTNVTPVCTAKVDKRMPISVKVTDGLRGEKRVTIRRYADIISFTIHPYEGRYAFSRYSSADIAKVIKYVNNIV